MTFYFGISEGSIFKPCSIMPCIILTDAKFLEFWGQDLQFSALQHLISFDKTIKLMSNLFCLLHTYSCVSDGASEIFRGLIFVGLKLQLSYLLFKLLGFLWGSFVIESFDSFLSFSFNDSVGMTYLVSFSQLFCLCWKWYSISLQCIHQIKACSWLLHLIQAADIFS